MKIAKFTSIGLYQLHSKEQCGSVCFPIVAHTLLQLLFCQSKRWKQHTNVVLFWVRLNISAIHEHLFTHLSHLHFFFYETVFYLLPIFLLDSQSFHFLLNRLRSYIPAPPQFPQNSSLWGCCLPLCRPVWRSALGSCLIWIFSSTGHSWSSLPSWIFLYQLLSLLWFSS